PPETAHGGMGTQTYLKAHGLSARGHEIHVISASPDTQRHEYQDKAVRVTRIPGSFDRMALHTQLAEWITYSAEEAATGTSFYEQPSWVVGDLPEWGCEGYVRLLNRTKWHHIPTVIHPHGPLVMFAHTVGWPPLDSDFYRIGTGWEGSCLRLADPGFS